MALDEKFRTVGQVTSAKVCRDSVTHRSLLYGYVNFARPEDAKKALDELNHDELMGKPMRVSYVQRDPTQRKCVHCRVVVFWPLPSRPPCCLLTCARLGMANIHIKNLQKDINEKSLSELMSKFGSVVSLKVCDWALWRVTCQHGKVLPSNVSHLLQISMDEKGQSRGYGFVNFSSETEAKNGEMSCSNCAF
jgi:polyadenylate-binding protein